MISPTPNILAHHHLLEAVVLSPGCWTTSTLSSAMGPPRFDATDYPAWVKARKAHTVKIGRALGRLVEGGLLEKQRGPRLAQWAVDRLEMLPRLADFVRSLYPVTFDGLDWPGDDATDEGDDIDAGIEIDTNLNADVIIGRLMFGQDEECQAVTTRDLLGSGSSGAMRRAYRWLCERGVIEAPSLRWPTAAGVALVQETERRTT